MTHSSFSSFSRKDPMMTQIQVWNGYTTNMIEHWSEWVLQNRKSFALLRERKRNAFTSCASFCSAVFGFGLCAAITLPWYVATASFVAALCAFFGYIVRYAAVARLEEAFNRDCLQLHALLHSEVSEVRHDFGRLTNTILKDLEERLPPTAHSDRVFEELRYAVIRDLMMRLGMVRMSWDGYINRFMPQLVGR